MSTKTLTPKATLSYPHFHAPQAGKPGQKAKYSGTFVFAPGTDLRELEAAALEAASDKFGATMKVAGKSMSIGDALKAGVIRSPFRTDALAKGYAEGSTFINCRSDRAPGLVYGYPEPGTNKPARVPDEAVREEFYPGAIVRASVTAFGYDTDGNKGVSFALNNVQKLANGERLDGRVAAEDEFDAPLDGAPANLDDLIGSSK